MRFFAIFISIVLNASILFYVSPAKSIAKEILSADDLQIEILSDAFQYRPQQEKVDIIREYFDREAELSTQLIPYTVLSASVDTITNMRNPEVAVTDLAPRLNAYDSNRGSVESYMLALTNAIQSLIRLEQYNTAFELLHAASAFEQYEGGRYYQTLRISTDFHISFSQNDYASALEVFQRLIDNPELTKTWSEFGKPLHHIYHDAGIASLFLNKPMEALQILKKGKAIQSSIAGAPSFGMSIALARTYTAIAEYDHAEKLILQNLDAARESGRRNFISQALQVLAEVHLSRNETNDALSYLNEAWSLVSGTANRSRKIELQKIFVKAYEQQQNYQSAFEAQTLLNELNDNANLKQLKTQLAINDAERQIEQQTQQIKLISQEHQSAKTLLKQEKNIRQLMVLTSILSVILIIGLAVAYFFQRSARQKLQSFNKKLELSKLEAQEANEAKSLFLASMSHEIRTPMNGVLGMAQLLKGTTLTDKQSLYLNTITNSGNALLSIINDILDFSKVEAGKIELSPINFSIEQTVHDVAALLTQTAEKKGIALHTHFNIDGDPWFMADANRLRQILMNVVGNAIKFTNEGHVQINVSSISLLGGEIRLKIVVSDTGIGIKEEQLEKLFTPFTQADASTTREYGGTGLGLSISKSLANLMGGDLTMTSEYGHGTKAIVEISTSKGTPPTLAPQNTKDLETKTNKIEKRLKVLLAEDNAVNQMIVKHMLTKQNIELVIVDDGQAAVDAFETDNFDLVLMDITMPKLDGLKATKKIRDIENMNKNNSTQIIALTAHAFKEEHDRCLQAGMNDFLTKPIKQEELMKTITSFAA